MRLTTGAPWSSIAARSQAAVSTASILSKLQSSAAANRHQCTARIHLSQRLLQTQAHHNISPKRSLYASNAFLSSKPMPPPVTSTTNVQGDYQVETYISKLNDPWTNLAFEEWLFRNSDPSTYILYMYRNSKSVIIGRNQNPWKECNFKLMTQDNVPFVRRKSGGGTVYHDMGNTNYSIMMPRAVFDRKTNVDLICRALHQLDIPANVNDRHDIMIDDRKVSGSAYKLIQHRAYHHGTMLIDTDLTTLGQYLKVDKENMITKGVPSYRSAVNRLREYSFTVDHLSFCEAATEEFLKRYAMTQWRMNQEKPPTLVDEKYIESLPAVQKLRDEMKTWEWMYGQTPEFTYNLSNRFSWGKVDVELKSKLGILTGVEIDSDHISQSLSIAALAVGLEGQKYGPEGLDLAVERIWNEAPEVMDHGGDQKVAQVVSWLKEQL